ncbi:MAG: hypothetical protein K0U72_18235 [Gammaproteobacteria bacterium]|nr:hypothetical protein [Gammaproteobacteria bacterium]
MQTRNTRGQLIETRVSNLRAAVAAASFILVMGTMVITKRYSSSELLYAVLFATLLASVAFLSRFDYRRASKGIVLLGFSVGTVSLALVLSNYKPIFGLWASVTIVLATILLVLRRRSDGGDREHYPDI